MNNFKILNNLLHEQAVEECRSSDSDVFDYARAMAAIENAIVVISDIYNNVSHIHSGLFGERFNIKDFSKEPSIWEKDLLSCMSVEEQEAKFLSELRFYHYLKGISKKQRPLWYLATRLRMKEHCGELIDVLHRMYYTYDKDCTSIKYAICIYGPLTVPFTAKSIVINTINGSYKELSNESDKKILSSREKQVLTLIDKGNTSAEIAEALSISPYTVSRHRQEILAKLQVKNSLEACRVAKIIGIL